MFLLKSVKLYIPLSPSLQKEVKEKCAAGIAIERIMNGKFFNDQCIFLLFHCTDIQSQISGHAAHQQYRELVNRQHLVTHQDLHNITQAVHNYNHHHHSEDIFVDRIVTEL